MEKKPSCVFTRLKPGLNIFGWRYQSDSGMGFIYGYPNLLRKRHLTELTYIYFKKAAYF
ncbi:MAG: hypothetical protein KKH11_04470 [Candidatus Omnitrophica bacterium]|nr:hypothetical protein [Candidatus Omnitrophota bacterium]